MTREEWIDRYAAHIVKVCGPDKGLKPGVMTIDAFALEAAATGAECAEENEGPDVVQWIGPEDSADEEMSNWDNDE